MNNINSFTPLNYLINQENFAVTRHWSPLSSPSSSVAPKFVTIIDPSSAPRPSVFYQPSNGKLQNQSSQVMMDPCLGITYGASESSDLL